MSTDGAHPVTYHFEMWALCRGGITPGEAIRAATMTGAEKLGIQQDVGSLTAGKRADFLVLASNPLDDIQNSLDLTYTVSNGIVYDSDALEVVDTAKIDVSRAISTQP